MLQTSISAWLNKPRAVAEPPPAPSTPRSPIAKTSTKVTTAPALPSHPPAPPAPLAPPQKPAAQPTPPTPALPSRKPRPLPSNITLEPVTPSTLPSLRRLNSLLLPIPYPQKFYDEILSDPVTSSITLVALWHDTPPLAAAVSATATAPDSNPTTTTTTTSPEPTNPAPSKPRVVAGIRCRLLPSPNSSTSANTSPNSPSHPVLYISTLATLSPYRTHGLATHLLQSVVLAAHTQYGVVEVCAHVWEANTEALAWYKRRGFEVRGREEGYYRRLKPQGAWAVGRRVQVGEVVGVGAFGGEEGERAKEEEHTGG
ncbi:hypothetical protein H2201_003132 [Coniosporium apollinis]|uniref:N-acetyltransferase domain-containing protein n=1 Tax=Coniosporium apollinis TaxID=61459 RepID=A0ABQ9P1K1_9PEZI|nr:hypothetical protein H2201_003132 [Coniosporium apollinis]